MCSLQRPQPPPLRSARQNPPQHRRRPPRKRLQKALRRLPPPKPMELPRHLPQRLLTALRRLRTLPPRKPRQPHLFLMPASPENWNASSDPGPGSPRIPSTSWPPRTRTLPYRSLPDRQHPPKHTLLKPDRRRPLKRTLLKPGRQPSPEHLVISLPQEASSNFSPKRERVSVRRTLTLFFLKASITGGRRLMERQGAVLQWPVQPRRPRKSS